MSNLAIRLYRTDGTVEVAYYPTLKSEAKHRTEARKMAQMSGAKRVEVVKVDAGTGLMFTMARFVGYGDGKVRREL